MTWNVEVKKAAEARSKCEMAGILLLATLMLVLATLACSPGKPWSTAGASPTPQKGSKTCHFGDAVRVGDLVLTLEVLGPLESEPGDGSRSILILYTVENQGFETESITDLLGLVHLEDDADQEYEPKGLSYSLLLPNQTSRAV